jgi:hypothetical protein
MVVFPLGLEKVQSLFEDGKRAYISWRWFLMISS